MAKSKSSKTPTRTPPPDPMAGLVCKGDIVTYCLTDKDAEIINLRRRVYAHSEAPQGVQVYSGAPVQKGNAFPMIIIRKNKDDRVNG
jgi:hypothetical protein